jgi:hypothetical protein
METEVTGTQRGDGKYIPNFESVKFSLYLHAVWWVILLAMLVYDGITGDTVIGDLMLVFVLTGAVTAALPLYFILRLFE